MKKPIIKKVKCPDNKPCGRCIFVGGSYECMPLECNLSEEYYYFKLVGYVEDRIKSSMGVPSKYQGERNE
jgi:hypothetical protein